MPLTTTGSCASWSLSSAAVQTARSRLEITLWLLAVTPTRCPRARVRLAAAGWPLDRQDGPLEERSAAADGVERRLARLHQGRPVRLGRRCPDARRHTPQQIERRAPRTVRREVPGHDLPREPQQTLSEHPGADVVERHERPWMGYRRRAPALQVYRRRDVVERDDLAAESPALLVGFGGGRVLRRVPDLDLVGLVREAVPMDDGAFHLSRLADVGQRAQRRTVGDQFLLAEAAAVEELPPHGLVLAPVELQEVRQQAARPLVVIQRRVVRR